LASCFTEDAAPFTAPAASSTAPFTHLSPCEGTLYKSVVGVFIMIVLGNSLNLLNVDSYWQRIVIGAVIIAAAAFDRVRHR
jgi:ribose transport system permease protein